MAGLERIQQRGLRRSCRMRVSSISKVCILVMLLAAGVRAVHMIASGNFDEVIPGILYRSAQPDAADIEFMAETFGVKNILNLRDEAKGNWYREEAAAAQRANVQLIDFPISSGHPLSKTDLEKLIVVLNGAPKPMLVHCEHGANRTGLVAAIFVKLTGSGSWLAELQLSPYYGHVPIPGIGRFAMQESWELFKKT
ncbi:Tyrosine phosphatase family protein [compost metagenome]